VQVRQVRHLTARGQEDFRDPFRVATPCPAHEGQRVVCHEFGHLVQPAETGESFGEG
jgi:hypothetical protein